MKPIIAITIGDFNGIGPEIALKAASHPTIRKMCEPVLVGPLAILDEMCKKLKVKQKLQKAILPFSHSSFITVLDVGDGIWADVFFGKSTRASGRNSAAAIEKAVDLCLNGQANAMVTSPVSKEALHLAGYHFPGLTEMIAVLSRSQKVAMMLVSNKLRVGLLTTHIPLSEVAQTLTKERIIDKVSTINNALQQNFNVKKPVLAILSINPHSGEEGVIGKEEVEIMKPAIGTLIESGISIKGPFAADAFFGTNNYKKYDATIAAYHDQGLIPLKMLSFRDSVNYSAGLKIIRTSPGHGTAYDIAGKNSANISSMFNSIKLAVEFIKNHKLTGNQ